MMLQVSSVKTVERLSITEGWKYTGECEISGERCRVMIVEAARHKCPRCWTHASEVDGEVCYRCADVLSTRQDR
jgi:isoleucyl-tRNA synthetase